MATCPECGRRDAMTLDRTGRTTLIDMGPALVAGVQLKRSAREVDVLLLACDPDPAHGGGCGWSTDVYLDGDGLTALTKPGAPT